MERKYIIVNHQTNPECTSDYPATRTFAGTIEECAKKFKELYDENTESGRTVTDAHDDEVNPDTIEQCVKDGLLHCLQVATGYIGDINDFSASVYTILPVED